MERQKSNECECVYVYSTRGLGMTKTDENKT